MNKFTEHKTAFLINDTYICGKKEVRICGFKEPMLMTCCKCFTKILLGLTFILTVVSCQNNDDDDPDNLVETDILFLGHRGSGINGFTPGFIENTPASCIHALEYVDGLEIDIQMSLDSTIWIYHDQTFKDNTCPETGLICIPKSTDAEIESLVICFHDLKDRVYRLSELFDVLKGKPDVPDSLDIKTYFTTDCFPEKRVSESYIYTLTNTLAKLISHYKMEGQILIECTRILLLNELQEKLPELKLCYMNGYPEFNDAVDRAIQGDYDSISFRFDNTSVTKAKIDSAQAKGLIIQLWTPNSQNELGKAFKFEPDYIQTDNIDVKDLLHIKNQ